MKKIIILIVLCSFIFSCGYYEKRKDEGINYRSIIGKKGTVKVTLGGEEIEYKSYSVEYSDSDATTLLIKSPEGKYVYIQGFAIIEFDDDF